MAQVLRPPPKRRPSQIVTQASAASSQPSSQAPSSHPISVQPPNVKKCAALAEQPPGPGPSIPKEEASVPAAATASTAKAEASLAHNTADAGASTPKAQASTEQVKVGPSASMQNPEVSADQVAADAGASTPKAEASANQITTDTTAAGASEVSQDKTENASGLAAAALQTNTEELAKQEGAAKPPVDKPGNEDYVSPFEQAQEGAAATKQGLSPFANIS